MDVVAVEHVDLAIGLAPPPLEIRRAPPRRRGSAVYFTLPRWGREDGVPRYPG